MPQVKFTTRLKELGACRNAIKWVGRRGLKLAWRDCQRGDWMLRLAEKLGVDKKLIVQAACDCAQTVLKYTNNPHPAEVIRIVRLWCEGKATIEEVRTAASAAHAADAAAASADAAYAAVAASADADAAAAHAADAAAASADDADAAEARKESLATSAELVRTRIPYEIINAAYRSQFSCHN